MTYINDTGAHIINISRPVIFMKKTLGQVHVGLNQDLLSASVTKEKTASLRGMLALVLIMTILLASAAVGLFFFLRGHFNGDHLPERMVKTLLDRPTNGTKVKAPWGDEMKRNQVSVVFVGIRGFKSYSEKKGPRPFTEDFNEYLSIVTKLIEKHGGYVDKFIGDGVIAIFGNSLMTGDHAEKAVNAALAMQEVFQKKVEAGNQLFSKVGMGVSSGVVLTGQVGSESKRALTFIGESFKTAYSLNVLAGPGEIMISKEVYQMLGHGLSVEPLPPREILHRTQSWENFRVLGKSS